MASPSVQMGRRDSGIVQSIREMKDRLKARVRVRAQAVLQYRTKRGGATASATAGAASFATTFAATRVFKGNVVLARLSQSMATKAAREQIQKGCGASGSHSSSHANAVSQTVGAFRKKVGDTAAALAGGSALVVGGALGQEPCQAEASLALGPQELSGRSSSRPMPMYRAGAELEGGLEGRPVEEQSELLTAAQAVMLPIVANMCYVFMHGLNRTEVLGAEKLVDAIQNRPKGQALVTVCNHVAAMDDPLVLSAMVPPNMLVQSGAMRWTLCATDRCFKNAAMSAFFRSVKVLPLKRGEGVDQRGMDMAVDKVRRGDWVHIFPEGSRSRDGGRTLGTIKRGIGRLLTEGEQAPVLLPFIHSGMQHVLGVGTKVPRIGNNVTVLVGDPIPVQDLIDEHRQRGSSRAELYDAVAARVAEKMQALKGELAAKLEASKQLHEEEVVVLQQGPQGVWDADVARDPRGQSGAATDLQQSIPEATCRSSSSEAQPILEGGSPSVGLGEGRGTPDGQAMENEGEALDSWRLEEGPRWRMTEHFDRGLVVSFAAQGLLQSEKNAGLSRWGSFDRTAYGFPQSWQRPDLKTGRRWWKQSSDCLAAVQRGGLLNRGELGMFS